jgi:hypothetical protein
MPDHFYCLDPHGEIASEIGYEREESPGYVYGRPKGEGVVPILRWFNDRTGDHYYCRRDEAMPGNEYRYEGIEWYMHRQRVEGTVALYRWYNETTGHHFYTSWSTGEFAPTGGYTPSGTVGYLFPSPRLPGDPTDTVPIFRWHNTGVFLNFSFHDKIEDKHRRILLERHSVGYFQVIAQSFLSSKEISDIRNTYKRPIYHELCETIETPVKATINGSTLVINMELLQSLNEDDIARALLHQIAHCAGYRHSPRHDAPNPTSQTPRDDEPYHQSVPLRAELCITGKLSEDEQVSCNVGVLE